MRSPRSLRAALAVVLTVLAVSTTAAAAGADARVLLADRFDRPDQLETNGFATWNPTHPEAVRSPVWEVTSGSLFVSRGTLWSGVPDDRRTGPRSETGTDSAVLRATTHRTDLGDVAVSARLRLNRLVVTDRTPAKAWDGVHVFLRRQSEDHTYYVSVARRDGKVVIKKKVPAAGGTYHTLAVGIAPLELGVWTDLVASATTLADGSVRLALVREGVTLLEVVDRGVGGAPITTPGGVGFRGDNADLQLDDLVVAG